MALRTTAPAIIVPFSNHHAQRTPTLQRGRFLCMECFLLDSDKVCRVRGHGFLYETIDLFMEGEAYVMAGLEYHTLKQVILSSKGREKSCLCDERLSTGRNIAL